MSSKWIFPEFCKSYSRPWNKRLKFQEQEQEQETHQIIRRKKLPFTFLRNSRYFHMKWKIFFTRRRCCIPLKPTVIPDTLLSMCLHTFEKSSRKIQNCNLNMKEKILFNVLKYFLRSVSLNIRFHEIVSFRGIHAMCVWCRWTIQTSLLFEFLTETKDYRENFFLGKASAETSRDEQRRSIRLL